MVQRVYIQNKRFEVCKSNQYVGKFAICLLSLALLITTQLQAQSTLSNLHSQIISPQTESQFLDSLTIIPHSISIQNVATNDILNPNNYNLQNNHLIWKDSVNDDTEYLITYRTFPYAFTATRQHLDTLKIAKNPKGDYIGYAYRPTEDDQSINLLGNENLDYSGSFARGIAFGNSQDLVLNSSFNLQLAGTIGDDVEIVAAISDENVPLQPEGNTQNLQDFDQLSIQISKDNHELRAGDYELESPDSYFMNYYKKLQGATYRNTSNLFEKGILKGQASVALTKGKFARQTILVQEGNQGPYRLHGNEGESFLIILSSTERVYLDGRLLQRGLAYDYVIDYNRGDLTFTNKILITKDSRIVVEFEYSDQSYLRSIVALNSNYEQDNLRLFFNVYSEQDSKNTSGLNELSAPDKQLLASVGDAPDGAFGAGLRAADDSNDPIKYRLVDTLVAGIQYDSILVYTTVVDNAQYTARFSEVGMGNGNYIRVPTAANGTVFQWVSPNDWGEPQGDFEPVVRLLAPALQQMYTVGADYQISEKASIQTEVALSNRDINRFSKLDSNDDLGMAMFSKFHYKTPFGKKDSTWQLSTDIAYEFKQTNFQNLKPYRAQEFIRDWNLSDLNTALANEHIGMASVQISKQNLGALQYRFSTFLKGNIYTGQQHFTKINAQKNDFDFLAKASLVNTESDIERSQFFRPNLDVSKTFEKLNNWTVGIYSEQEHNERFDVQMDTLRANSFAFGIYRIYLESAQDKPFQLGLHYQQRYDYNPLENNLVKATFAEEFNMNGQWSIPKNSNLRWNVTYRNLEIENSNLTKEVPLATILSNVEYGLAAFKGAIRSNTTYQISSGQEPQLAYNYIEVNTGEGLYQWNDYNQDSLQQVNEFEIAVNQDLARYIRVSVLTDDFIRMNKVQFNQSFALNPAAIWRQKEGCRKALSRFSTQSIFKISRRTRETPEVQNWNPFQLNLNDTALVATNSTIQNTLFFNRTALLFDAQIGMTDNRNRTVLNTGFESRRRAEQFAAVRYLFIKKITTKLRVAQGRRTADSELFDSRDFSIAWQAVKASLDYQIKNDFRFGLAYIWSDSENDLLTGGETALQKAFEFNMIYNQSATTALKLDLSYVNVDYIGPSNTPVAYALLEGLQDGENFLWNLTLDRQMAKNIQLSIGYEGRKTGVLPTVHIGRMQVRATF